MLRKALRQTIPVMAGYIFLGIAYGISMQKAGFSPLWSVLISVIVFGGSLQFAMIGMLGEAFSPFNMALVALLVQARHLFYGISMLDKYSGMGKRKPYLIFALSDETYSLVVQDPPGDVDRGKWYSTISMLDQGYWVIGTVLGALIGSILPMSLLEGVDFAMTALFTVIVTEQTMDAVKAVREKTKTLWEAFFPPLLGFVATIVCLLTVGKDYFLLATMGVMIAAFLASWFVNEPSKQKGGASK